MTAQAPPIYSPRMPGRVTSTRCCCNGVLNDDKRCVECGKSAFMHLAPWTSDLTFASLLLETSGSYSRAKRMADLLRFDDWLQRQVQDFHHDRRAYDYTETRLMQLRIRAEIDDLRGRGRRAGRK